MPAPARRLVRSDSVADAVSAWLRGCRLRGLSPVTIAGYARVLRAFDVEVRRRGDGTVADLTVALVGDWLDARPLVPASRRHYVRTARAFSRWWAAEVGGRGPARRAARPARPAQGPPPPRTHPAHRRSSPRRRRRSRSRSSSSSRRACARGCACLDVSTTCRAAVRFVRLSTAPDSAAMLVTRERRCDACQSGSPFG